MTDLITFRFLFRRDEEKKEISVSQFPETIEVKIFKMTADSHVVCRL